MDVGNLLGKHRKIIILPWNNYSRNDKWKLSPEVRLLERDRDVCLLLLRSTDVAAVMDEISNDEDVCKSK